MERELELAPNAFGLAPCQEEAPQPRAAGATGRPAEASLPSSRARRVRRKGARTEGEIAALRAERAAKKQAQVLEQGAEAGHGAERRA